MYETMAGDDEMLILICRRQIPVKPVHGDGILAISSFYSYYFGTKAVRDDCTPRT